MIYDRNEESRRRELKKVAARTAKLQARLAEQRRRERSVRSRLLSTTRHETWHAHRLAYQDRQAGYDGEMAEARYYLRALPPRQYFETIAPFAKAAPSDSLVAVEFAAVEANLEAWTKLGKGLLFERARVAYEEECRSFQKWAEENPGEKGWRERPATRVQWMLIRRTVEALSVEAMPSRLSCGEAFDWLQEHGANVRFRGDGPPDDAAEGLSEQAS